MMEYDGPQDDSPITETEINKVINKMRNGKAPRWDRVDVVTIKKVWQMNTEILIELFNSCWKYKIFPNEWKRALVVTLLKSEDKDASVPSSYRPICLLPIMGKVMEGIILSRMKSSCDGKISTNQYGFVAKRSTEDALNEFLRIRKGISKKYILCIFLGISNAFNNLWWPAVVEALKKMECSKQIVAMVKGYLRKRQVIFRTEAGSIAEEVNKGCPQGSLLGSTLWNVVFKDLIVEFDGRSI